MRMRLVPEITNWDFFGRSKLWLGVSALMMVVAFVSFLLQGLNYGIDFRGGTTIRTESAQPVDVGAYRDALAALELGDVVISEVFDPNFGPEQNVAMIRIGAQDGEEAVSTEVIETAEAALLEISPDIKFVSVESVGPKVSGELIRTAAIAVALAIGAVLVYIWLRFEWQFAVGAIIATTHDVLLTIGMFVVTGLEFNLSSIAAILTIVGYSLNDTVVVYDRVRENLRRYKKMSLPELLDLSMNQTLPRTIQTSLTTVLALLALFFFGGEVLQSFVAAMIFGVVVGTYSSIFIAAPLLILFRLRPSALDKAEDKEKQATANTQPVDLGTS